MYICICVCLYITYVSKVYVKFSMYTYYQSVHGYSTIMACNNLK